MDYNILFNTLCCHVHLLLSYLIINSIVDFSKNSNELFLKYAEMERSINCSLYFNSSS